MSHKKQVMEGIRAERAKWYGGAVAGENVRVQARGRLDALDPELGKPKMDVELRRVGERFVLRLDSCERPDFWAEAEFTAKELREMLEAGEAEAGEVPRGGGGQGNEGEESKMDGVRPRC